MARGWESKAVADQIEEGKKTRSQNDAAALSPEERVRQQRIKSLQLSRTRLLEQLDKAKVLAHRSVLLNGLSAVERELEELR